MASRRGFTLVELLVAAALIIFIMAIISEAFVASTKTFRDMKAVGDMAEKLRSATTILRRYLAADHFEGKKRLSDPTFWLAGPPQEGFFRVYQKTPSITPMPSPPVASTNYLEGTDPDASQPVNLTTTAALHFSVKLRGNTRGDFFSAAVPATSPLLTNAALGPPDARWQDTPSTYNAQWAEVAFFTRPLIDPNTGVQLTANGTPLYSLFMRQRLAVPDNAVARITDPAVPPGPPGPLSTDYLEVSGVWQQTAAGPTGTMFFNSPRDLTQPARRFAMNWDVGAVPTAPTVPKGSNLAGLFINTTVNGYTTFKDDGAPTTALLGSDLLLSNLVSFDVRLLAAGGSDFVDVYTLAASFGGSSNPNFSATTGPMVFDTWSSVNDDAGVPLESYDYTNWSVAGTNASLPIWNGTAPTIKAIQIILRVWDDKTEQTRQVTLVVPL
jgi:prepilin-type N-terminal cleavage/methylation domain-containing protein